MNHNKLHYKIFFIVFVFQGSADLCRTESYQQVWGFFGVRTIHLTRNMGPNRLNCLLYNDMQPTFVR